MVVAKEEMENRSSLLADLRSRDYPKNIMNQMSFSTYSLLSLSLLGFGGVRV